MSCDASIFFIQTISTYTQCMTLCTLRITLQTTGEAADTHCKVLCVQCIAYHAQYTHLMYKLLMLLLRLGSTCAFIFFCVCVVVLLGTTCVCRGWPIQFRRPPGTGNNKNNRNSQLYY